MADVQNEKMNGASDAANAKKRKGFWSKLFRQSNKTGENKQEEPKKNFMGSIADSARQAATREVMNVAEHEAMKEVEGYMHNNNNSNSNSGSQPTNGVDTSTMTTPSEALSAPTSWAKRMVDSAQQKVQGLAS